MVSYCQKYVHEVLVNRLGGLSLPRKSVVRLTDRPDMTLFVYRGRKTTIQQQLSPEDAAICTEILSQRAVKPKTTNQPSSFPFGFEGGMCDLIV